METTPARPGPSELALWATYTAAGFKAAVSDWLPGEVDLDEAELTRIITAMSPEWLRQAQAPGPCIMAAFVATRDTIPIW